MFEFVEWVNLSKFFCYWCFKELEKSKVILGYCVEVVVDKVGLMFLVLVFVMMKDGDKNVLI